jgi:hypothetical protein
MSVIKRSRTVTLIDQSIRQLLRLGRFYYLLVRTM